MSTTTANSGVLQLPIAPNRASHSRIVPALIDDYRRAHGIRDDERAIGDRPTDPEAARSYTLVATAIERLHEARHPYRRRSCDPLTPRPSFRRPPPTAHMSLEPIEYRGELVALVGPDRFHVISPRVLACPPDDPELRFVAFMRLCHRGAAEAGLTGYVSGEVLERWARQALIDMRELSDSTHVPSAELARRLHVPSDQIVAARAELEGPCDSRCGRHSG